MMFDFSDGTLAIQLGTARKIRHDLIDRGGHMTRQSGGHNALDPLRTLDESIH